MKPHKTIYIVTHIGIVLLGLVCMLGSQWVGGTWVEATLFALGTSIIAAGVCGLAIWVYISNSDGSLRLLKELDHSGLGWIYPKRAAQIRSEYADRLDKASTQIDILGFGLKDFKRDYMTELGTLSKRARVRILVLDPDSAYGPQRDLEENQSQGVIQLEVQEFIDRFKALYQKGSPALQLRKYRSLPEVNIFRIDKDIFWGPYLAERASSNTPTIRVRQGGYMFDALESHFERIWADFSESV